MADITASSFNDEIRNKIQEVLEDGYGDTLTSSLIVRDPITNLYPLIDDVQWDNLRLDIVKARVHQIGTQPTLAELPDVDEEDVISTTILEKYVGLAERALIDIALVANGQYEDIIPPTFSNPELTVDFSGDAFHRTTVTFTTPQQANQFFNAGGGFLLSTTLLPLLTGPQGAQSRDFQQLAVNMGTKFFGRSNWRTSTSNYSDFATPVTSTDSIYSGNRIRFRAALNSSSSTLANQVILEVRLESVYASGIPNQNGVGYGDQTRLLAAIDILQRQSALSVTSPLPASYSYAGSWTITAGPVTYPDPPAQLSANILASNSAFVRNNPVNPFLPVQVTGGVAPYVWSISPNLPTGLIFDGSTGQISGTPTVSSTATSYRISVIDNIGQQIWRSVTIGVGN